VNEGSRRLEEIRELFAYDRWANGMVLDATAGLTEEEFGRDVGGSFPSVRETLVHVAGAEFFWMRRWKGHPRGSVPEPWVFGGHASVRARWVELEGEMGAFLDALTAEELDREIDILTGAGIRCRLPMVHTMRHVVNHSTYHRGQVMDQLRHLGASTAATDLFLFHYERSAAAPAAV
jgi:uncharacterized damage-inducible protein DinB